MGMGRPGATLLAGHRCQHRACPIHIHVFFHLSCSNDLKCIEGSWERASLTKGKEEKCTEETALPMQQALWLLKSSLPSQQSPGLWSRSFMAWDSLCCTATGKTRCWCSAEVCGLQGDAQPQINPPEAVGLTGKLWDEGSQHRSRDWDTGIGKASVYKGQVPVTKITLCFPSLSLPCPTLAFVDVLKYKFSLGKMEAPSVTNQTKKRGENRRGGRENKERQIRIKHRGMLNRLRATVLASAVRQLSELIA